MFKIGDFSRLATTSIRMLRYYDKIKLLTPAIIDEATGYRYYTAAQLSQINKIKKLKEMGFSLAIIKELVAIEQDPRQVENYLKTREKELQVELDELNQQQNLLKSSLKLVKEDELEMDYHVSVKLIPARQVISVRRILTSYHEEGQLWKIVGKALNEYQLKPENPSYSLAIFRDEEYKDEDVDVEIQMAISETDPLKTNIFEIKKSPSIKVASVMMNGSYDQLPAVNEAVAKWFEVTGEKLKGPMFNIYHVSPGQDANPVNWVTEVCYPLNKKEEV
ncbi:MerR family transcriptional regulator [Carnobacterium maltaromaticum]|uniref:MerR family transcriptional regulator n=1 Tax=Carnobacterium maltaromaticum TaxID=2751 RepID=UPI00295F4CA0|nr:MerR family transcriptional regulator [Carnobacterium maltaromaticum]